MIGRKTLLATFAFVPIFLAGCARHYNQALAEYRLAEPLPFTQRTTEWTQRAERETSATLAVASPLPRIADSMKAESAQDVFVRLTSEFFATDAEQISRRVRAIDTAEELRKALSERLDLDQLLMAVAIHDPAVKAAQKRWQATLRQYSQAIFLDQLVNEYRSFTRYLNVGTGKPLNKQMAQSYYPYPSMISLKGEMIRQQVRLAELDWQQTIREEALKAGEEFFQDQYLVRVEATRRKT